jgi:hypothetical protein
MSGASPQLFNNFLCCNKPFYSHLPNILKLAGTVTEKADEAMKSWIH